MLFDDDADSFVYLNLSLFVGLAELIDKPPCLFSGIDVSIKAIVLTTALSGGVSMLSCNIITS
ncbi:hypothetical protein C5468_21445 [Photorhabdus luminescens subsp. mexicana]|uniref:Uncharacterized protein n=1 Tax=Photorhabdus luminescens subsp. mexicana TaxID=2100167 RepID=A0A4R4IWJ8_PHOLU|nr:hypothetical protein C5468_21445 [Photorhabdus luminescens subsp. mexicana]